MKDEDGILKEFLVECSEGLERLEQEFVTLEKETTNIDLLRSIFRTIHTIKGTCGFLGLPKLENVAHGAEDLLSVMRDGKMPVTPEGVTILLEAVDSIKEILSHIEANGCEPEKDYGAVRKKLDTFLSMESGGRGSGVRGQKKDILDSESKQRGNVGAGLALPKALPVEGLPAGQARDGLSSVIEEQRAESSVGRGRLHPASPVEGDGRSPVIVAESSIRVDVGLLDRLMNLVGELVLARNQLLQRVREQDDTAYAGTAQRMNLITTELQDTVMKTRMQPIRNLWEKFPRLVRDLALANVKEVDLIMNGADTELDRTLLEAIKDPLTHIVRNSVDHGIETPDVRRKKGKKTKGTLILNAYHEGGQINIEITDDGSGINTEKVKRKAVEKGLVSADTVSHLSEREALNLIFIPGLSTADKITNVSGRGVGMDVVKTNIEKIGGTVELTSRIDHGTSIKIKIPLTLAIIPALMITSGKELFAIPQASLLELVRVDIENGERIEIIHSAGFYRLRGTLLPILYLNQLLRLEKNNPSLTPPSPSTPPLIPLFTKEGEGGVRLGGVGDKGELSDTNIVVLRAGDRPFGLVVDTVNNSEEIVVKPLGRQIKGLSVFAGATIMGDGRVALILDVTGIAKEGGILKAALEDTELRPDNDLAVGPGTEHHTMILFSVSGHDRFAIQLAMVARLEEFDPGKIEQAAGREVMQYREGLLPLIHLDKALGKDIPCQNGEMLPTIVFARNKKSVGLVVNRILDIIEAETIVHPPPAGKTGITGSMVIDGLTTDLLDIDQIIETAEPGWLSGCLG